MSWLDASPVDVSLLELLEVRYSERYENTGGGPDADADFALEQDLREYEVRHGVRFVAVPVAAPDPEPPASPAPSAVSGS